jgi:hypothetical protein
MGLITCILKLLLGRFSRARAAGLGQPAVFNLEQLLCRASDKQCLQLLVLTVVSCMISRNAGLGSLLGMIGLFVRRGALDPLILPLTRRGRGWCSLPAASEYIDK